MSDVLSMEEVRHAILTGEGLHNVEESHAALRKQVEEWRERNVNIAAEYAQAATRAEELEAEVERLRKQVEELENPPMVSEAPPESYTVPLHAQERIRELEAELLDARGERDAYMKSLEDAVILYREGV